MAHFSFSMGQIFHLPLKWTIFDQMSWNFVRGSILTICLHTQKIVTLGDLWPWYQPFSSLFLYHNSGRYCTMRYSISRCTFLFNKPGGLACLSRIKPGSKNLIPAYLRDKKLFFKTKTFKRRDSTPIFSKAGIVSFWDKTKSKQNLPKEEIVLQNWHYPFFIVKWKIKTLAVSLVRRDKINLSLILSL